MRVLVTGGAGFIGSHTVVELLQAGHEVVILDDLSNAKPSVIDRITQITDAKPDFIHGDVRDRDIVGDILTRGGIDACMHFAGLKAVGESVERPLSYYDVNVGGAVDLLEMLDLHGVRTFVFSSSATVYGDPDVVPVTEAMPTKSPTNPYGKTKLVIEEILRDLHGSDGRWNIAILRYFNPIGAHESGLIGEDPNDIPNNLMPYIAQVAAEKLPKLQVYGDDYPTVDGTGIRDYIHVVDLARGHLAALDRIMRLGGLSVWNLGTGRGSSVLELVAAFEAATRARIPYEIVGRRPGDIAETWADVSKAESELAWKAQAGIAEMCADTWRWQQHALRLE